MPDEAKHGTHAPLIETAMDTSVSEAITKVVEIAPSVVCYCRLPVARYKVRKPTSIYQGQYFLRCPRNHCTNNQCSFF